MTAEPLIRGQGEVPVPEPAEERLPDRDDCIYAAGLFDGEGSAMLTIRYQIKRKYRSVVLCASVANTYLPVLLWVRERWGGTISTPRVAKSKRHKLSHLWIATSRKAAAFLTDVSPFVRVKRAQVDNALAFQSTKRPRTAGRGRLTDTEWTSALAFLRQQRRLNARGPVAGI